VARAATAPTTLISEMKPQDLYSGFDSEPKSQLWAYWAPNAQEGYYFPHHQT